MTTQDYLPTKAPRRKWQLLHHSWRDEAEARDEGLGQPLYALAQRWSPVLLPSLIGGISLVATLLLSACGLAQVNRMTLAGIPLFFLAGIVGGVALAYMLDAAESEASWLATVVFGSGILMAVLLSTVVGLLVGLGIIGASAVLALRYVQSHLYKVSATLLVVTQISNRYLRTLPPDVNILLPGERIAASFETRERRFLSPTHVAEAQAQDGSLYSARAAAMVGYRLEPALAYRTLLSLNTWERDLHATVGAVLKASLMRWAMQVVDGEDVPQGALAQAMLVELSNRALQWGVAITSVHARNIRLEPADPSAQNRWRQSTDGGAPDMVTAVRHDTPTITTRPSPVPPAMAHTPEVEPPYTPRRGSGPTLLPDIFASTPAEANEANVAVAEEQPKAAISPETLAETYKAIRERRITDPATIRLIARAFTRFAEDHEASSQLPYDAAAAAHILTKYAAQLDERATRRSRSPVSI